MCTADNMKTYIKELRIESPIYRIGNIPQQECIISFFVMNNDLFVMKQEKPHRQKTMRFKVNISMIVFSVRKLRLVFAQFQLVVEKECRWYS